MLKEIETAYLWTVKNRPKHYNTLRERRSGSTWHGEVSSIQFVDLFYANWVAVVEDHPFFQTGCDYYRLETSDATCPEFAKATTAVRSLRDFSYQELDQVFLVEGDHGIELISSLVQEAVTKEIWMIVGSAIALNGEIIEGESMVWTCHPGRPMTSVKTLIKGLVGEVSVESIYEQVNELDIDVAVKKPTRSTNA
jgi:hypothetical protein